MFTKTSACLLVLLLCACSFAAAQQNPIVEVKKPVRFDISPPLRDIAIISTPHVGPFKIIPLHELRAAQPGSAAPQQPDAALQNTPGPLLNATPGGSFDGVGVGLGNYSDCCAPPDTNMAVGPNDIVQWVNLDYAIFDKSGNLKFGPSPGNSFWSGFGGPCEFNNDGDPIAQYDAAADRWVMSQFAIDATALQCFAVSRTNDPTGSYARYAYDFGQSLNDYPKIGIWPSGYFASYNMFLFGAFFQGPRPCAYDRAAMLAGNANATQICFQQSSSVGSLLPADLDGSTPPPGGSPNYFVAFGTNVLQMWKFTPNFANPSASTFTGPTNISVSAFTEACASSPRGACIPQSGTTQQLESLADRLMYRLAYRNFGTHESLVVNHAINAGSSVGVRWYELRNPNGSVTVHQQGTYAPDSNYRWMGSIAMDKASNMALGYSTSSSSMFPSIHFTGREPGDPLGTLQSESLMMAGGGSQQVDLARWGDYSAMRIDPSDDCTFWFTTEYLKSNGTFNWSTRIGSFKFSSCGAPPTLPADPTNLVANAVSSSEIDLTWSDNSDNESGFKIERCQGAGCTNFAQIATTAANVASYNDTGLASSTTYRYRVRAFNGAGDSGYSDPAEATTQAPPPPPNAPSNLNANALNTYQISLGWQDNATNEDGSNIYRCVGCADPRTQGTKIASVGANVTTYTDGSTSNPLTQSTTYTYQVTAFNVGAESGASNAASATTQTEPAPSNLQSTTGITGKGNNRRGFVDLTWTDNSSDEDSYRVERCQGAGCTNFAQITSTGANATSYRDSGLARRTTFRYRVRGHSPGGFSGYSNITEQTTP